MTLWGFPQKLQYVPLHETLYGQVQTDMIRHDSNSAYIIQITLLKSMIHFGVLTSQITVLFKCGLISDTCISYIKHYLRFTKTTMT